MAGRGRGRGGRGRGFSFDISQIGFQIGEALPAAILQPPPLFPPLEFKPVPLSSTETDEYLLALKQEFRGIMQESQYFIKPDVVKKDVDRYSDKYKSQKTDNNSKWEPDWSRLPDELKEKTKRKLSNTKPSLKASARKKSKTDQSTDVTKRLEELEKNDKGADDDDEEDQEQPEEEQEYDEEEQEEDNDYLVSHYDDGEEVGFQDEDDMDEGPVY